MFIWMVPTTIGSVREKGFRSGLDLKKEEIPETRPLRRPKGWALQQVVGLFNAKDF